MSAGVVAAVSFWRDLEFKAAITVYVVLFYIGVAVGHFREALMHGDYSPDNFGLLLILTLIKIFLLPGLLLKAYQERSLRQ